ncbi:putative oxidoreductase [Trichodelitschia bisporula]|uniref:Putative oxidoreductase n=1 Tax=Trichodelitschia bisporula TaxID=703511 RepID=A0A6G1HLM5_9PEZI|nr:putative oxidoreductase [Trichodelitschia bisporula]
MAISLAMPWHSGEQAMHRLMNVPEHDNPTSDNLNQFAVTSLHSAPLIAIGALDDEGRPWTTLWGGETPFMSPLGGSVMGIKTDVDVAYDPVLPFLIPEDKRKAGDVVKLEDGEVGRVMSGLATNLMTRRRVKLAGRFIAGAVDTMGDENGGPLGRVQLVLKITESVANCPKYLNQKDIRPAPLNPTLVHSGPNFPQEALELIKKADMFFMSSSNAGATMDSNHRGGPAGFVRVISNDEDGAELVYPEYSGNRMYQSLGNLLNTPLIGIVIPDYDTGDALYLTGTTTILPGEEAARVLPRSNLAVKIKVTESRFIKQALPFRGIPGEQSPYNPAVRALASEGNIASQFQAPSNRAQIVEKIVLGPTVSRYRLKLASPVTYKAGQWVALDFSEELDIGYSHMRNDDPTSLNDDFIRTFTISSPPQGSDEAPQQELEVTLRDHGPVTKFLQRLNIKRGFDVPVRGIGGEFVIKTPGDGGVIPFVAGGVGITPLLGQLPSLDLSQLRLIWITKVEDAGFVLDTFKLYEGLSAVTTLFFTGKSSTSLSADDEKKIETIRQSGARAEIRRPTKADFEAVDAQTWYLCAGKALRNRLMEWLAEHTVLFENFDY